jgi:hypothetical protein
MRGATGEGEIWETRNIKRKRGKIKISSLEGSAVHNGRAVADMAHRLLAPGYRRRELGSSVCR